MLEVGIMRLIDDYGETKNSLKKELLNKNKRVPDIDGGSRRRKIKSKERVSTDEGMISPKYHSLHGNFSTVLRLLNPFSPLLDLCYRKLNKYG